MDKKLVEILKRVTKPARYVGHEFLMPNVNHETRVKFCLCFPDVYEKAMSNMTTSVIYNMLNDRKGYSCERCFAPWPDMGKELAREKYPLFSLENKTSLSAFDILNFHFTSPMQYTNMLYMLSLAQIPLESERRKEDFPFVCATGICMANPEPLASFIDFAIIGDQEDATIKVIDTVMKGKLSKLPKQKILDQIANIDGVYIPRNVEVVLDKTGILKEMKGKVVKRQIVRDLDRAYFPEKPMVSNERPLFERYNIEIMRGCTRGCRFCQAGFMYRPIRERRVQNIVAKVNSAVIQSGLKEVGLLALSSADYGHMPELLKLMNNLSKEREFKLLTPSLRADMLKAKIVSQAGRNAYALSIEAGSERLRNVINRALSDDQIFSLLADAFKNGYVTLKLNFMIGLPFETSKDLLSIATLVEKIRIIYNQTRAFKKPLSINIAIETFIPKAFTPFEWCQFIGVKEAQKRQEFLRVALKKKGVRLVFRDPQNSMIEAVLSRGDRRLSKVLKSAFMGGAIFDTEPKLFNFKAYESAFKKNMVEPQEYLKRFQKEDAFAFDLVDIGVSKDFLYGEYEKAKKAETTPDCRLGCKGCGLSKMGVCVNGGC